MGDELKEKAAAEETIPTDADLEAAANLESDKEPEPEKKDEKPPEEPPGDKSGEAGEGTPPPADNDLDSEGDEPKDNAERSKLGRRVAGVERQLGEIAENLTTLLTVQQKLLESPPKDKNLEQPDDVDEDLPLTKKELEAYLSKREQDRVKDAKDYLKGYVASVYKYVQGETDKAFSDEIIEELNDTSKYPRRTNNPSIDAYRNYLEANIVVLRKKVAKGAEKKNPLEKNSEKKGDGLKVGSDTVAPPAKAPGLPQLDKDAQDFLNYVNGKGGKVKMSEDDVRDALSKPFLTGKKDARHV